MKNTTTILSPTAGTFSTIAATNAYLAQLLNNISGSSSGNNLNGATVIVRGLNTVPTSTSLSYNSLVKFVGDTGALTFSGIATLNNVKITDMTIVINGALTISNTTFDNCNITVNSATGFSLQNNCQFNKCTITYAYDATSDGNFTSGNLGNYLNGCLLGTTGASLTSISNIVIQNCTFTTPNTNYFSFITFQVTNQAYYLANINITNNQFNNTTGSEDQRSVIGIVSTIISSATPAINGPRVADINIEKNVCNKNQLISITATLDGSNIIQNMLVPVNVNILNNICGAINYLTRQDIPLTSVNSTQALDKKDLLKINGNICKFIYSGFSNGFYDVSGDSDANVGSVMTGHGLYTSSVSILNNSCAWIAVGYRIPSSYGVQMPFLDIADNNLTNNNATLYQTPYFVSSVSAANVGVYVKTVIGT